MFCCSLNGFHLLWFCLSRSAFSSLLFSVLSGCLFVISTLLDGDSGDRQATGEKWAERGFKPSPMNQCKQKVAQENKMNTNIRKVFWVVNLSLPWWALSQRVCLVLLLWKVQKLKSPWKNRFFRRPCNIILLSKKAQFITPSYNIYEHENLVSGLFGDPLRPSTLHRPFLEIKLFYSPSC